MKNLGNTKEYKALMDAASTFANKRDRPVRVTICQPRCEDGSMTTMFESASEKRAQNARRKELLREQRIQARDVLHGFWRSRY